ncbi:MAG: SoxR reducing system RseC family protein [Alistipes sp.]|nr:SoxR reducing system RseC family protein [Alistipes sp.]
MGHTIQHRGRVERVTGDRVTVRVEQQSACAGCHAKGVCGGDDQSRIIEVTTPYASSYEVGERVVVALLRPVMALSSIVWGYLMPLLVLLVVLVAAKLFGVSDGVAAVITLASMAIYYVALYFMRRRFERKIQFTIIKE